MYKIKGLEKYRRPIPRLNDGQFKAIHDSLAKWQFLSWHPKTKGREPSCECCKQFSANECEECPVAITTGKWQCVSTKYYSWLKHDKWSQGIHSEAEDEYHFLEGIYFIELHRRLGYGKV